MAYVQLTLSIRRKLEELLKEKVTIQQAAKEVRIARQTLYTELRKVLSKTDYEAKRYELYSAEKGQEIEEQKAFEKLRR